MNLLLCREISDEAQIPDFGPEFAAHIDAKQHPDGRRSSINAWSLLAEGLSQIGIRPLPAISFLEKGKPVFCNLPLHFSISHSGSMAAVLISDVPCAVDIEHVCRTIPDRMVDRCLSDSEKRHGCDFFEVWTKKECICKLDGSGLGAHPARLDTLDAKYEGLFFNYRIADSRGAEYVLTALCSDGTNPKIYKR